MTRSNSTQRSQSKGRPKSKTTTAQAKANLVAREAIIAAFRAVNAANPKYVKQMTRLLRKACPSGSLQDARDAALWLALTLRIERIYVGRPGALRSSLGRRHAS